MSVIINERSGPRAEEDQGAGIQARFAAEGMTVRLERVRHGGDIAARARQAAARGDLLVAAGGDGTVGTVAAVAVESGTTLGVLPTGTLNHFAKDAGIPLDLSQAVRTIVAGHVRAVDVGEVNGRIFVNNSSIGLYARMVWERHLEQRKGRSKWTAFAVAMARTWRRYPTLVAHLTVAGTQHVFRTPFIFVGNNAYFAEGFNLGARAALDRGELSIFVAPQCGRFEILAMPFLGLVHRLDADPHFARLDAKEVSIELSRPRLRVATDGEVALLTPPLQYRVRPGALRLFVPAPES
jgi:diacylglycerol kinase family enzyme